jgi:hypothetical protein
MPIDPAKALGHSFPPGKSSYHQDQVILYHLGIGAGNPPTDPNELSYTYEKNLKVLPSFGVIPTFSALGGIIGGVPGLTFNPALLLHGEQDIEIHRPLPVAAKLENQGRIAGLYDKGKAALAVLEVATRRRAGRPSSPTASRCSCAGRAGSAASAARTSATRRPSASRTSWWRRRRCPSRR